MNSSFLIFRGWFHLMTMWLIYLKWPWILILLSNCEGNTQSRAFQKAPSMKNILPYSFTVSIDGLAFPLSSCEVSSLTFVCLSFLICINRNNDSPCVKMLLGGKSVWKMEAMCLEQTVLATKDTEQNHWLVSQICRQLLTSSLTFPCDNRIINCIKIIYKYIYNFSSNWENEGYTKASGLSFSGK